MHTDHMQKSILQKLANKQAFWDFLLGPMYNLVSPRALSEIYVLFANEVRPGEKSRILDVGSGPGDVCLMLAEEHPSVSITGVDFSRTEVRSAERSRRKKGINNCRFLQDNAMGLSFENATFDIVISLASIKHWPDKVLGLKEMARVLVPGGRSLVLEANSECTEDEFAHFASKYDFWWVYKRLFNWCARLITVKQGISPGEAETMARAAGFAEIEVKKPQGWPFWIMSLRK